MSVKKAVFLFIGFLFLLSCSSVNKGFDKRKYTKLSTLKVDFSNQETTVLKHPKINVFNNHIKEDDKQIKVELKKNDTDSIIDTKILKEGLIQESNKKKINYKIFENQNIKHKVIKGKSIQKKEIKPKEYNLVLLVLLCFLLPFLAVGLKTNWDLVKVIIALILWPLFLLAIIYALLIVYDVLEF
jgi:uncharacterized membrane protein YqaE (UPF0057 family)